MPSERRQRQQRVRHEAGDYVPSSQKDDSPDGQIKEESVILEQERPKEELSRTSCENNVSVPLKDFNRVSHENVSAPQRNYDRSFRREDIRMDNRFKDRGRGRGRGGDRGRGRGAGAGAESEYRPKENAKGPKTVNVAFAEEREYEPVMIMESKQETPVESAKPLETSQPAKYRRSEVISNWLRYDELPPEDESVEGEDYMLGEDFSHVLDSNVNKGSGSFLHLKGEMSWGKLDNADLGGHGLGALKIADLVAALGTIPLHEQLKIPEEVLPVFTVSTYKETAQKNQKSYTPDQDYVTDIEVNEKILDSLKLSEDESFLLPTEESKPVDKLNPVDATLKFSSAFQPEPDDVDLDTFIPDTTPSDSSEAKPQENALHSASVVAEKNKTSKNEANKSNKNGVSNKESKKPRNDVTPPVKSPPEEVRVKGQKEPLRSSKSPTPPPAAAAESKTGFDFGLSKLNATPAPNKAKKTSTPEMNKSVKEKKKEEVVKNKEEVEETIIDLDQPTKRKPEAPILVGKSEVENLEDWLDSVLDD